MHIVNICIEDRNTTIMCTTQSVLLLERTCSDFLWFSLLQQGIHLSAVTTIAETTSCSGSTQCHGWDTHFKLLEARSSGFSGICLCVIDHTYLLILSGTFRDSAGYVLCAASIFCCIRMCVVSMAGKHVCVRLNFCKRPFRGL